MVWHYVPFYCISIFIIIAISKIKVISHDLLHKRMDTMVILMRKLMPTFPAAQKTRC